MDRFLLLPAREPHRHATCDKLSDNKNAHYMCCMQCHNTLMGVVLLHLMLYS